MSFIEICDNALSLDECEMFRNHFDLSTTVRGKINYEGEAIIDFEKKKCFEMSGCYFSQGNYMTDILKSSLINCIGKYNEKYKSLDHASSWSICDDFTFKKYETEDDGFKIWHTEQSKGTADRIFVWQFYLNNAESGTEFMHYDNVEAKEGRCVLWPAGWTHMHRSLPNKGLKYVISGWVSFT